MEELDKKYTEIDKELTKRFGDNYFGFNGKRTVEEVSRVSTGCVSIDRVLGGGLPEGRIIEIYGNPSSSKTTVCLQIVSSYQKQGKSCLWVDSERCYDPTYSSYCGVSNENIAVLQPTTANDALEVIRMACNSGVLNLVVLDSGACLVPADEYEKDAGGGTVASVARLMSQMLKQIVNVAAENKCTVIFINQLRGANLVGYGAKTTTTGGSALEYYASIRLQVSRSSFIEVKGEKVGIEATIQTTKNKTATPFKSATLGVYYPYVNSRGEYEAGVDLYTDLLDCAIELDIVKKAGSWISFEEHKVQGKEAMRNLIIESPELFESIKAKVYGQT